MWLLLPISSLGILRHMTLKSIVIFASLALLPISELRGAIPYGLAAGGALGWVAPLAIGINCLVPLIAFLFLDTLHKLFLKWAWYARLFESFSKKTIAKIHPQVEKYGYLGLLVFVAIPLPITGAWTGALGAWLLEMDKKKASIMIFAGVICAGIIVSLVL